jgi:hypothetical protein
MKIPTTTPAICSGVRDGLLVAAGKGGGGAVVEVVVGAAREVVLEIIVSMVAEVVALGVVVEEKEEDVDTVLDADGEDEVVGNIRVVDDDDGRDVGVDEVGIKALELEPEADVVEEAPELPDWETEDTVEEGGLGERNVVGVRVSVTVVPAVGGTNMVVVVNTVVTARGATVVVTKIVFVIVVVSSETNTVVVVATVTVVVSTPVGSMAWRLSNSARISDDVVIGDMFFRTEADTAWDMVVAGASSPSALLKAGLRGDVTVMASVCVCFAGSMNVRVSNTVDMATIVARLVICPCMS